MSLNCPFKFYGDRIRHLYFVILQNLTVQLIPTYGPRLYPRQPGQAAGFCTRQYSSSRSLEPLENLKGQSHQIFRSCFGLFE